MQVGNRHESNRQEGPPKVCQPEQHQQLQEQILTHVMPSQQQQLEQVKATTDNLQNCNSRGKLVDWHTVVDDIDGKLVGLENSGMLEPPEDVLSAMLIKSVRPPGIGVG